MFSSIALLFYRFEYEYAIYNLRWILVYSVGFIIGKLLNTVNVQKSFFKTFFCISIIVAIYLLFFHGHEIFYKISEPRLNLRLGFSNSSMLSCFLSIGAIIGVYYIKNSQHKFKILYLLIVLLVAFIVLRLSSRAAILMIILGTIAIYKLNLKLILPIIVFAFVIFFTFKQDSINGRLLIWKVSSEIIMDNPIIGLGPNRFGAVYNNYQAGYFQNTSNISEKDRSVANDNFFTFNLPIKLLSEYGFLFTGVFFILLFFLFKQAKQEPLLRAILLGLLGFALFSYPLSEMKLAYIFFILLGMGSTFCRTKMLNKNQS